MKMVELTQTRPTPFQGRVQGPLGGTSSKGDIMSLTFVKLKDWILAKHKG
jgi:hypothetical protein